MSVDPRKLAQAKFYGEHPPLAFPHRHPSTGLVITHLTVACDICEVAIPAEKVRGVATDYPQCTEFRYVAPCVECRRVITNSCRIWPGGRMLFLRDGNWCETDARPWWKRVWESWKD